MKYLTTTFAIACMAFGFASVMATPAQTNESWECAQDGGQWSPTNDGGWTCLHPVEAQVKDVEPLEKYAEKEGPNAGHRYAPRKAEESESKVASNEDGYDRARQDADWVGEDENGNIIYEKDGRVIGVETANADINASVCAMFPTIPDCSRKAEEAEGEQVAGGKRDWNQHIRKDEEAEGEQVAGGKRDWNQHIRKDEEAEGEQFARGEQPSVKSPNSNDNGSASERTGQRYACSGNDWIYGCKPTKTPTGTFYPLPMVDVASMEKLLAPGGTTLTAFTDRHGKSFGDSDYQFADREDGSGGDFGNSGGDFGGDFGGEGDRAAASTAAE